MMLRKVVLNSHFVFDGVSYDNVDDVMRVVVDRVGDASVVSQSVDSVTGDYVIVADGLRFVIEWVLN